LKAMKAETIERPNARVARVSCGSIDDLSAVRPTNSTRMKVAVTEYLSGRSLGFASKHPIIAARARIPTTNPKTG